MDSTTQDGKLQVMIIEDEPEWRGTFEAEISRLDEYRVCASVATISEAKRYIKDPSISVDIAIVDLMLPDGNGHEFIQFAALLSDVKLLACSNLTDSQSVITAIEQGACGYILKGDTTFSLCQILSLALQGGAPISPSIANLVLKKIQAASVSQTNAKVAENNPIQLTKRQSEILGLVAKGYKTSEVAEMLSLTYNTVSSHIKTIYKKLQVHSRTEAIFEASQQGLFPK